MKISLKKAVAIISILALLIPITYSYALSVVKPNMKEKQFFEISKTEFTKNEKVEMIINLDSIKYNEFIFELKSDEVIENVEIVQSDEIDAEKNNNEIIMEVNKAKTNVKTINLFYEIPENKNVGDTIKFIATITGEIIDGKEENEQPNGNEPTGEEESELPAQKEDNKIIIEETENNDFKLEKQSIEIEIKIIEEKNDDKQEDNKQEENKPGVQIPSTENNNQIPNKNNGESSTVQKIPTGYSNIQYNSMSNISIGNNQTPKVTYNGSDNNYLSELSVEGYTFNRTFSKENTTYFVTVENGIEKLNITAKVDDDESIVNIYGNENLKEGTNKILIAVTAENGNVRNYRIYVTKNS